MADRLWSWVEVAHHLQGKGWTVIFRPLPWLPPYEWRSPCGLSGSDYRSDHPDAPPEAVMRHARKRGDIDFEHLSATEQP